MSKKIKDQAILVIIMNTWGFAAVDRVCFMQEEGIKINDEWKGIKDKKLFTVLIFHYSQNLLN